MSDLVVIRGYMVVSLVFAAVGFWQGWHVGASLCVFGFLQVSIFCYPFWRTGKF